MQSPSPMVKSLNPIVLFCLLGLLALATCGGGGGGGGSGSATVPAPQPPSGSVPAQLLTNAKSQSQLLTTFRAAYDSAMSGQRPSGRCRSCCAAPRVIPMPVIFPSPIPPKIQWMNTMR